MIYPHTPRVISTPRGPVELVVDGEGPALLALHGAMGGWDQSLLLARTLAEPGYTTCALSRPGYLGTPLSAGRTPEDQADLYAGVLDALGIDRVGVMAVSGGGPSAIHFALRHPDRCWGLVLASTTAGPVDNRLPFAFHVGLLLARLPSVARKSRQRVESDLDAAAAPSIDDPALRARTLADPEAGPLFRSLLLSTVDRMAERGAGTRNDVHVTRTRDYPLEAIRVPTLVVHGTRDRLVPFEDHGAVLARRIPGAELAVAEGGDHVAMFTHHAELQPRAAAFLRVHAPEPEAVAPSSA